VAIPYTATGTPGATTNAPSESGIVRSKGPDGQISSPNSAARTLGAGTTRRWSLRTRAGMALNTHVNRPIETDFRESRSSFIRDRFEAARNRDGAVGIPGTRRDQLPSVAKRVLIQMADPPSSAIFRHFR